MGDWNAKSPTIQGLEVRPGQEQLGKFEVNNIGFLQRFRAGTWTLSHDHVHLRDVVGSPGLGIEILDTEAPTRTDEDHFPGTDTSAVKSAWQTLAAATSTFAAVDDDFDDTDGLRNISAVARTSSIQLQFRGADTALSAKRIDRVQIWVRVKFPAATGNSTTVRIRGQVNIGAKDYTWDPGATVPANGLTYKVKIADWQLNPATSLPWTMAEVNLFIASGATDEFGFIADRASIAAGANGLQVYGYKAVVTTLTENRKGFFYQSGPLRSGWFRVALSATSALTNNVYYWRHVFALRGSPQNYFTIPVLYDPTAVIQSDPTATGEHRLGSAALLTGASGVIDQVLADVPGTFMPYLLDSSGTIRSQSQPYAKWEALTFDSAQTANRGTEITSAAGTNVYAGVRLPVAWANPLTPPDQPLVVEIRDGAGMLTGAGNLRATATLPASVNPSWPGIDPKMADTFIAFDGGNYTPAASTQLFALVKSAASAGKGWKVPRLDSRSDYLSAGGSTTAANVQGETFGGTTDSYSSAGTEDDRFDMPLALIGPPTAPASPLATVRSAS